MKVLLVLALVAATAGITFVVTYRELQGAYATSLVAAKTDEIEQYLDAFFIDDYEASDLADGAAAGLIAATGDEWSYYISAADYAQYVEQLNNAYVGIGVTIEENQDAGGFTITSITPGGPADLGGVKVGDVITKVEDALALELGQNELVNRVRGEKGSEIRMTFTRDGEPYELTLTRSSIAALVASYEMTDDDIAVITIRNFDHLCAEQTLAAIEAVLKDGAKGIVFDVRNNPGGLKTEMVKVLDRLLEEGVLFRSLDYAGNEEEDTSDATCLELPMAVVVNENSYSAAEFFAAAMQEYDAATIVGVQTYGKGNFQNTFPLSDGSAIAISVGKYFTPNGISLTGIGITPDHIVEMDDTQFEQLYYGELSMDEDPQILAALEALR